MYAIRYIMFVMVARKTKRFMIEYTDMRRLSYVS